MSNTYEKIPSNPPKKVIKKKVQPVYDDYDNENDDIDDYEEDPGDFEQELLNQQKSKMKIPRYLNQNNYNDDDEDDYENEYQPKKTANNKNKISSKKNISKNKIVPKKQVKKQVKNYDDDEEEEDNYYKPKTKNNISKINKKTNKTTNKTNKKNIKTNTNQKSHYNNYYNDDEEEEEDESNYIKTNKKSKQKKNIKKPNNYYNDDEEEEEDESNYINTNKKSKQNKNIKKTNNYYNDDEEEEEDEDNFYIQPKKKERYNEELKKNLSKNQKKTTKKNIKENKKIEINGLDNIDLSETDEEEIKEKTRKYYRNLEDYDELDDYNDVKETKKSIKKQSKNTKENKINDNNTITNESKITIDSNNPKEVRKAKKKMHDLFATKKSIKTQNKYMNEYDEEEEEDDDIIYNNEEEDEESIKKRKEEKVEKKQEKKEKFDKFINKVGTTNYSGFEYKIKEEDYFVNNNKKYTTILNNESAAIKRCEEIFNSLPPDGKFIDKEFGSVPDDGGRSHKESLIGVQGGSLIPFYNLEWYPISKINPEAKFFDDGAESNDVCQGGLGDCWFISALSVLATKDYLLRGEFNEHILDDGIIDDEENTMLSTGVYPPIFHCFRSKGIFCMRFFKNFAWRYVIIDDRIPCIKVAMEGIPLKPYFGHCKLQNEFWVSLIEKAYAKIHGAYQYLVSGCMEEGIYDMTGLTPSKIFIEKSDLRDENKVDEMWAKFLKYSSNEQEEDSDYKHKTSSGKKASAKIFVKNKSMLGCGCDVPRKSGSEHEQNVIIQGWNSGLVSGHAYAILDCFELPKARSKKKRKCSRLMRIRNPWGFQEWQGKWCDDSEEIAANKDRINEILEEKYRGTNEKPHVGEDNNDGTFIMCYSDFRNIFNKVCVSISFPQGTLGVRFFSGWTSSESGGLPANGGSFNIVLENPQFYISVEKETKMFIALTQNDGRLSGGKFPFTNVILPIIFFVFPTIGDRRLSRITSNPIGQTPVSYIKINSLEVNLERGEYIVIPATQEKGKKNNFCLDFYFEDELIGDIGNDTFSFDKVKYTKIKKLGGPESKPVIIREFTSEATVTPSKTKLDFMYAQFQNCLNDNDNIDYGHKSDIVKKDSEEEEMSNFGI